MDVSSNLEVILLEKHSNDQLDPKFSLFSKPAMEELHDQEFQASTQENHELRPKRSQLVQEKNEVSLGLKIKIPSYTGDEKDDSNQGFKTPTSSEHKIPVILQLPAPPRKPKARPSTKRKSCRPQIVLDLSQEIESFFSTMFDPVSLGPGGKNKKVKVFTN